MVSPKVPLSIKALLQFCAIYVYKNHCTSSNLNTFFLLAKITKVSDKNLIILGSEIFASKFIFRQSINAAPQQRSFTSRDGRFSIDSLGSLEG